MTRLGPACKDGKPRCQLREGFNRFTSPIILNVYGTHWGNTSHSLEYNKVTPLVSMLEWPSAGRRWMGWSSTQRVTPAET